LFEDKSSQRYPNTSNQHNASPPKSQIKDTNRVAIGFTNSKTPTIISLKEVVGHARDFSGKPNVPYQKPPAPDQGNPQESTSNSRKMQAFAEKSPAFSRV
jgi:hypothetical protein